MAGQNSYATGILGPKNNISPAKTARRTNPKQNIVFAIEHTSCPYYIIYKNKSKPFFMKEKCVKTPCISCIFVNFHIVSSRHL